MNKKVLQAIIFCTLSLTTLVGCSKNKKDDGTNTIKLMRWDITQLKTAKVKKTPLYQAVVEATGVDFEIESTSSTSYNEKLNLAYASEELPDVFVTQAWDAPSTFKKWIRSGSVIDYTKYVNESNYPNLNARLEKYSFLKNTISYFNGGFYALPIDTLPLHCFYIRTDWIDNLNNKLGSILVAEGIISSVDEYNANPDNYAQYRFKIPETLTEFYRLTYAFTYYDPNNSGRNDTYGYSCCTANMWYNNWIFEAMSAADKHDSAYWGYVEGTNGELVSSWTTEGNKKSVYFLNKLFNEGILNPEYPHLSEADCRQEFVQGQIGIYMENFYYNNMLRLFKNTYNKTIDEAKQMFTCCIPPAGQYGVRGMRCDPGFWDGVCISNKLSERKINLALKVLDYLASAEAKELFTCGIEGVHYKVENGKKVSLMGVDENGFNKTLETYDYGFPLCTFTNWDYAFKCPYESNYEFVHEIFGEIKKYGKHDPVSVLQPEVYVEYDLALSNNGHESFVSFISNSPSFYNASAKKGLHVSDTDWNDITGSASLYTASFNEAWNTFSSKVHNDWHGDEILVAMNELYPQYKNFYKQFFDSLYKDI